MLSASWVQSVFVSFLSRSARTDAAAFVSIPVRYAASLSAAVVTFPSLSVVSVKTGPAINLVNH